MQKDCKPLIVANWKMNLAIFALDELLSYGAFNNNVVICPPFTSLEALSKKLGATSIKLGAQDCSNLAAKSGAFTGDISSGMLADIGCKYVIIGHSERRKYHLESNATIKQKISNAHAAGLIVILCVGESLTSREDGSYKEAISKDLAECLPASVSPDNTIIAYEPVWAIGTGKTANSKQIQDMHEFLTTKVKDLFQKSSQTFEQNVKIIYGGSVNEENSALILSIPHVSGLLIGGASLDSKKFYKIIQNER